VAATAYGRRDHLRDWYEKKYSRAILILLIFQFALEFIVCYNKLLPLIPKVMKKAFVFILLLLLGLAIATRPVMAGGDKVRGEKSEGPSYQEGECPFNG